MNVQELNEELIEEIQKSADSEASQPYFYIKRLFDIVISLFTTIVLSPLMICIAVIVKLTSEGPAIYKQRRVGRGGKTFVIYKFRTMVKNADSLIKTFNKEQREDFEKNYKLSEDPRITKIGSFLRKSSLDELPQLLNILKGEMTIVGPRPVTEAEIEKYGIYAKYYYSVNPGLTGMWQVNGRSTTTYDERVMMDVDYVKGMSLINDAKLIFKTFHAVLSGKGAC